MKKYEDIVNDMMEWGRDNVPEFKEGAIRDGFHSFEELYEFRKMYNAALFNEWFIAGKYDVHKSERHYDGELCFGGGWFIVVAMLPKGQITNHYKLKDWDLFQIQAEEKAKYKFDNHTGLDVIERLRNVVTSYSNGVTTFREPIFKGTEVSLMGQVFVYQKFTGEVVKIQGDLVTLDGKESGKPEIRKVNTNALKHIYKLK